MPNSASVTIKIWLDISIFHNKLSCLNILQILSAKFNFSKIDFE